MWVHVTFKSLCICGGVLELWDMTRTWSADAISLLVPCSRSEFDERTFQGGTVGRPSWPEEHAWIYPNPLYSQTLSRGILHFRCLQKEEEVLLTHGDSLAKLGNGLSAIAYSGNIIAGEIWGLKLCLCLVCVTVSLCVSHVPAWVNDGPLTPFVKSWSLSVDSSNLAWQSNGESWSILLIQCVSHLWTNRHFTTVPLWWPSGWKYFLHDRSFSPGIANEKLKLYGLQFHPEVDLTEHGQVMFKNFLFEIAKCKGMYTMKSREATCIDYIRQTVADHKVLVSGHLNQIQSIVCIVPPIAGSLRLSSSCLMSYMSSICWRCC